MELFITLLLICGACLLFMQYYSRPIEKPDRLSGRKVRYPKAPIFIFLGDGYLCVRFSLWLLRYRSVSRFVQSNRH